MTLNTKIMQLNIERLYIQQFELYADMELNIITVKQENETE